MADDHVELQDIQWENRMENINMKFRGKGLKSGEENSKDIGD